MKFLLFISPFLLIGATLSSPVNSDEKETPAEKSDEKSNPGIRDYLTDELIRIAEGKPSRAYENFERDGTFSIGLLRPDNIRYAIRQQLVKALKRQGSTKSPEDEASKDKDATTEKSKSEPNNPLFGVFVDDLVRILEGKPSRDYENYERDGTLSFGLLRPSNIRFAIRQQLLQTLRRIGSPAAKDETKKDEPTEKPESVTDVTEAVQSPTEKTKASTTESSIKALPDSPSLSMVLADELIRIMEGKPSRDYENFERDGTLSIGLLRPSVIRYAIRQQLLQALRRQGSPLKTDIEDADSIGTTTEKPMKSNPTLSEVLTDELIRIIEGKPSRDYENFIRDGTFSIGLLRPSNFRFAIRNQVLQTLRRRSSTKESEAQTSTTEFTFTKSPSTESPKSSPTTESATKGLPSLTNALTDEFVRIIEGKPSRGYENFVNEGTFSLGLLRPSVIRYAIRQQLLQALRKQVSGKDGKDKEIVEESLPKDI